MRMHATNNAMSLIACDRIQSHATNVINVINAISHAINAISDECDKSDTYHTCNIALLIPFPPPPWGTQCDRSPYTKSVTNLPTQSVTNLPTQNV